MPAFGMDQLLTAAQVDDGVAHGRAISGQDRPGAASRRGDRVFADNCAVCHGPAGKGNRALGAPDLTDAIWLYGGDAGTIRETAWNSRSGVMPRWDDKLDKATIRMLAAYRSEEHTSELQSLIRISYAVFCWQNKNKTKQHTT